MVVGRSSKVVDFMLKNPTMDNTRQCFFLTFVEQLLKMTTSPSHLILVNGCLVQFRVTDDKTMFNQQYDRFCLLDTYVCSGYYAAKVLPDEEYDPNASAVAKIYADGLETKDVDDDTIFMLVHRRQLSSMDKDLDKAPIPELRNELHRVICRARSRLERDAWCWAINCEIEKLVRKTSDREKRAGERGMPV